KEGFEITEVACWDRKVLQDLINSLEKNKTTTYFEILQFNEKKMEEMYISKLLPKLPIKQKEAITLALKNGYYNYPRKVNLDKLAKVSKVSKQTFRENLRKAEAKIIPKFISE
ncbi:MAG: helix-turn-helix domain-containing protein, partial [Candidatus Nanoarchaeia archaeon]|nr:helix-turn-helix domain-containing protein [Candidatus Nanoarchaeia archaeon]